MGYDQVVIDRDAILAVLRTIPDPEMPISIVDLGLVEEVRVSALSPGRRVAVETEGPGVRAGATHDVRGSTAQPEGPSPLPSSGGRGGGHGAGSSTAGPVCAAAPPTHAQARAAVAITLLPTFIGCPALDMIAGDVRAKVGAVPGVASVEVNWVNEPPWTVDRITPAGRAALKAHGVTVPAPGGGSHLHVPGHDAPPTVRLRTSAVPCPFCGSEATYLESPFGPTRCRKIHYCSACRNSFEQMKRV
jgi:ring-1,2-phenylacetyl-CoA epoxidase subunit PaaD